MSFPTLETSRVKLVKVDQRYVREFFNIMSNKEVMRYYGMNPLTHIQQAQMIISSFDTSFKENRGIRWGVVVKGDPAFIGTIGLNNLSLLNKRAEVGFETHPDYWHQGLTYEAVQEVLAFAFNHLGLYRISAVTYPDNEASIGLLKKLGMQYEGRLRGYIHQNGDAYDTLQFSLLQPEFIAKYLENNQR